MSLFLFGQLGYHDHTQEQILKVWMEALKFPEASDDFGKSGCGRKKGKTSFAFIFFNKQEKNETSEQRFVVNSHEL